MIIDIISIEIVMENEGGKYDKIAREFALIRQKAFVEKKYLDLIADHLSPGDHILDLGCGMGEPIAGYLIKRGFVVTGVDASQELLTMAQKRYPGMRCVFGDMRTFTVNDKFDAIIAYDSLFHLPPDDQKQMMIKFSGWLNNHGKLLFTSGVNQGEVINTNMLGEKFSYYSLSSDAYVKLLEDNHFSIIRQEVDMHDHQIWIAERIKMPHDIKQRLNISVREIRPSDLDICIELFQETVQTINQRDYTQLQLDAWAPKEIDNRNRWETLLNNISYVAEIYDQIVGFADLTVNGYLDRLFVHKDYQGKGIATALMSKIEGQAKALKLKEMKTEATITAKPFFEKFGFKIVKQQLVEIRGVEFTNYLMIKRINK